MTAVVPEKPWLVEPQPSSGQGVGQHTWSVPEPAQRGGSRNPVESPASSAVPPDENSPPEGPEGPPEGDFAGEHTRTNPCLGTAPVGVGIQGAHQRVAHTQQETYRVAADGRQGAHQVVGATGQVVAHLAAANDLDT